MSLSQYDEVILRLRLRRSRLEKKGCCIQTLSFSRLHAFTTFFSPNSNFHTLSKGKCSFFSCRIKACSEHLIDMPPQRNDYCYEATFGEYFIAAWSNSSLFSLISANSACSGKIFSSDLPKRISLSKPGAMNKPGKTHDLLRQLRGIFPRKHV